MTEIITVPDPRLREVSQPVGEIDTHVREVVSSLQDIVGKIVEIGHRQTINIGLAAPQVGELIRVFVIRLMGIEWVVINPRILKETGHHFVDEYCESVPGHIFRVGRPKVIKMRGLSLDGLEHTFKGHDLLAAVLKHEYDHLDGILIDKKGETK